MTPSTHFNVGRLIIETSIFNLQAEINLAMTRPPLYSHAHDQVQLT